MALEPINYGAAANDGTGDSLREAMRKSQANFVYLDQGKVDKVAGMGLSSNNFTNAERVKLANVAEAATRNLSDAVLLGRQNHTGTQPLSTISNAGTAAARNAQATALDTTDGRLMQVGAFGIGKPVVLASPNLNVTSQFPTGIAQYYVNDASNGPYTSFYGYLTVEKIDNVYLIQTLKAVETGVTYKRTVNNGVLGDWLKIIDAASAVGAIVTGSIIERGANANGEYTKFADGTQICIASRKPSFANISNLLFQWVFPAPFIAPPQVPPNVVGGELQVAKNFLVSSYSIDANGAAVACLSVGAFVSGDENKVTLQATAIGRWK